MINPLVIHNLIITNGRLAAELFGCLSEPVNIAIVNPIGGQQASRGFAINNFERSGLVYFSRTGRHNSRSRLSTAVAINSTGNRSFIFLNYPLRSVKLKAQRIAANQFTIIVNIKQPARRGRKTAEHYHFTTEQHAFQLFLLAPCGGSWLV